MGTMATDGVALIPNVDAPESLDWQDIGNNLEGLMKKTVGKLYSPPARKTKYGVMRANMEAINLKDTAHLSDYNMKNPLCMHTDHAIYHNVPGYLQYLWQAQGSVRSKVCNGIAVAEYILK